MLAATSGGVKPGFDCYSVPIPRSFPTVTDFYAPCMFLFKLNRPLFQKSFGNSLITLMREDNHQLVVFSIIKFGQTPSQTVLGSPFTCAVHTHIPVLTIVL